MPFTPLPILDDFLLNYHVGHALVLLFVMSVVGSLPTGSRKVLSINTIMFGVLFLVTPASMLGSSPFVFRFLGIALLVVAPLLFTTARR